MRARDLRHGARPKELRAGKNWKFWVGHFKFQEQEVPTTPSLKPKCFREQKVQMSSHRSLFDKPKQRLTCFRDFQEKETLPLEIEKFHLLFQKNASQTDDARMQSANMFAKHRAANFGQAKIFPFLE